MIDLLSIVLRALGFLAIFQAVGLALFLVLFERQLDVRMRQALRRSGVAAALFALLAVGGHFVLEPARMGGALSAILDSGLRQIVIDSPLASAFGWRIAGLALLVAGLAWVSPLARAVALLGAASTLVSFIQTGHTASFTPRPLLAGLLLVHLGVVAFWFGSLLPLRRIALQEPQAGAGPLVASFSKVALVLVPALGVAGLALAVLLLGGIKGLTSPYGRLILLKIALFAVLMALAALNRWRFGPALARGEAGVRRAFGRTVLAEYFLIAAVLAVTAAMTTLYSPGS